MCTNLKFDRGIFSTHEGKRGWLKPKNGTLWKGGESARFFFCTCLFTVTTGTQGLKIIRGVEKLEISTVRDDMINISSFGCYVFESTLAAERFNK